MEPFYFVLTGGRALVFREHYDSIESALRAVADAQRLFGRAELRDKSPFSLPLPETESAEESTEAE